MDNPHDNIKTLCHAYEVMKRPPAVGLQVGSVPQEPAFAEMAELRKLIMKNARLLQPEQLVSGSIGDTPKLRETLLKAGTVVKIGGMPATLTMDTKALEVAED